MEESCEKCKVCGFPAIGLRYGVPSCGSCKKFFQRNCSRSIDAMRCELGRRHKKPCDMLQKRSCAKCRLEKCFEVGMKMAKATIKNEPPGESSASGVAESTKAFLRKCIADRKSFDNPSTSSLLSVEQQASSTRLASPPSSCHSAAAASSNVATQSLNFSQPLPPQPVDWNNLRHEVILRQIMHAATDASKVGFQQAVGVAGYLCSVGTPNNETDFFKLLSWSIDRSVRSYLPFATQIPGIMNIQSPIDRCCLIDNAYVLSGFPQWAQYNDQKDAVFASSSRYFAQLLSYWPELEEATVYSAELGATLQGWKPSFNEFLLYLTFILSHALPEYRISDPVTAKALRELADDIVVTARAFFYQQNLRPEEVERKMNQLFKLVEISKRQRDGRQRAIASLYVRRPDLAEALLQPVANALCDKFPVFADHHVQNQQQQQQQQQQNSYSMSQQQQGKTLSPPPTSSAAFNMYLTQQNDQAFASLSPTQDASSSLQFSGAAASFTFETSQTFDSTMSSKLLVQNVLNNLLNTCYTA